MGGHADGALASREIVCALAGIPRSRLLGVGARRVYRALTQVNAQLLEQARRRGQDIVGSTVVVFLAVGRYAALLWAGDSRAYRLRGDDFVQLTMDHSRVQAMVDAALVAADEAEFHPLANVLVRAVGSEEPLILDQRVLEVRSGDRFLLCSDGLYRELTGQDMAAMMRGPPAQAASALVACAREHGGKDNISAVVLECTSPSVDDGASIGTVASNRAAAV